MKTKPRPFRPSMSWSSNILWSTDACLHASSWSCPLGCRLPPRKVMTSCKIIPINVAKVMYVKWQNGLTGSGDVDCITELARHGLAPVHTVDEFLPTDVACGSSHWPPGVATGQVTVGGVPVDCPRGRVSGASQRQRHHVCDKVLHSVRGHQKGRRWLEIWKSVQTYFGWTMAKLIIIKTTKLHAKRQLG